MRITSFALAAVLVTAGLAGDAAAAPKKKKPITKSYSATAGMPDPTNWVDGASDYSVCAQNVPGSFHSHAFKAPAPGKIKITMTEFIGDWDLLLVDSKGVEVTHGGASDLGTPGSGASEVASSKIKKAGTYQIIACNWAGGSTAKVTYTFTYA